MEDINKNKKDTTIENTDNIVHSIENNIVQNDTDTHNPTVEEQLIQAENNAVIEHEETPNVDETKEEIQQVVEPTQTNIESETNIQETKQEDDNFVSIDEIKSCENINELLGLAEKVIQDSNYQRLREIFIVVREKYDALLSEIELNNEDEEKSEETQIDKNTVIQDIKDKFTSIKSGFSKCKKEYLAQQEAEKLENLSKKQQILEELKVLVDSEEETIQKTWEDFKQLQNKWKDIGQVPLKDNLDLWNNFNFLVDRFLDKVKINKELRDLDYKKNLETKIEICEKIEELLLEDSVDDATRKLRSYQSTWREIGSVPYDKREEINERFQRAIDNFNEKRKAFYDIIKIELNNNLEIKKALIKKTHEINENEISNIKEWNSATEQMEELFSLWKYAGNVPKKDNVAIWDEFRAEMKIFYNKKKIFFTKLKEQQLENYNKKLLLCKQAEALQESNDWKKTTEELIKLQNEWKTIGSVPKRHSEALWKRFRAACDVFFNRKQDYFANIDSIENTNLQAKKDLIEQIHNFEFGEDKAQTLIAIKDFQRKFIEIGRVPLKEKDAIQKEFSQVIDKLMEKLKISSKDKHILSIKAKYEHVAGTDAGKNNMKKEAFQINHYIQKLENDIKLWENNISFFAKSKNADILTAEFQEKIEKAKVELIFQKEKLKALQQMSK